MVGRSVFTKKQIFGPRTAKSQPIWIKFCKRLLLLYEIHLWADLDRDWRVGGSRPNDYVFVILVTHRKILYRDDVSPRFRRQTVRVEGAIVKNSGIL